MVDEDQNVIFTQLLNKRRKLANLRNLIQSRSDQAKAGETGTLVADDGIRDLYEDPIAGPSYCHEKTRHEVDARIFESACLDPDREISGYDSDDSVKDKTYEPHKDLSDGSYVQWIPQEFHTYYKNLKHSESQADFPEVD